MRLDDEDDILDRNDVERIAHEVIGRQFRLPALFSVVLLIVGFVLGHYVASRHIRDAHGEFEERLAQLDSELASVKASIELEQRQNPFDPIAPATTAAGDDAVIPFHDGAELSMEAPAPPGIDHEEFEEPRSFSMIPSRPVSPFRLSGLETHSQQVVVEGLSRRAVHAAVQRLKNEAVEEKESCLTELRPYLERRVNVPAATVSTVLEELFAAQDRRLERVVDEASEGAAIELHDVNSMFRSAEDRMERMFPPSATLTTSSLEQTAEVQGHVAEGDHAGHQDAGHRYFPKPRAVVGGIFFTPKKTPATVNK